ncbi:Nitronate monooxygenase [Purpureocillium lavendulum]|uniref:Nitronate monooxygenase n=1 Tax=Purpureocillium lavendulum TaxID=1247861 RepID=A0AB34FTC5_9HYPO|nr:Nitronate monooxygenase [Purpureocillium lavendulum]
MRTPLRPEAGSGAMDLAYAHIAETAGAQEQNDSADTPKADQEQQSSSLEADIQDAYKAISSSAWGVKIGGFFGNVVKQGESVYSQAQKELAEVSEDATKGFTDLRESIMSRTRALSINTTAADEAPKDGDDNQSTPTKTRAGPSDDATQESETVLSRLRSEAAKRLKDLQKAEDAADEALLRFGSNVRDFLRDAISVAPPDESDQSSTVLFESRDAQGKRVIHTSRFDAQLHVIHTAVEGFGKDPSGPEFEAFAKDFDIDSKTDDISGDLAKYPELRTTMEALVPDQVPYPDFWKRYYFLRHGIETAESRRRDLLKAEEDMGWGDDSDEEADGDKEVPTKRAASATSSTTLQPNVEGLLKPTESRKSNDEKSQADSEASYDVVGAASGKTSQAPNSPKEVRKDDDSDDDWE